MSPQRATGKYQLLDPLSPEDYAALETDILERGVMMPIEFDEDGNVIDGHHRLAICEKHGITDYPSVVRKGWTEQQKRTHSRRMNLARRQLTAKQRRRLVEAELRDSPADSNRKIGATLGVDHKTVATVRRDLETTGEIPHLDVVTGMNGKPYKRTPRRRSPNPTGEIPRDAEGNPVPDGLVDVFRMMPELIAITNELRQLKRRMLDLGPLEKKKQNIKRLVDQLHALIVAMTPKNVHGDCGGRGCDDCGGLGYSTGAAQQIADAVDQIS